MMSPEGTNGRYAIVKMENITKRFGGICAVDDVSLNLYKGEVLALGQFLQITLLC